MSQIAPSEFRAAARAVSMLSSLAATGIAVFVAIRNAHRAKAKKRV